MGGVSLSMCVALWRTDRGPVCAFAARPVWTRREDEIREEEGEDNTIRKGKKGRKKEKEKKKTGRQKTGRQKTGRRRRGDGGCKRD